jgi:tetratricopeptide (TPR) repeat protein
MRRIRYIGLIAFISLAQLTHADFSDEFAQAASPLNEGVPEVAIVRLKALLARNLPDVEWRTAAEKLGQAEIAVDKPQDAFKLLSDARLRDSVAGKFWRAQALAAMHRWADALPLYEAVAADKNAPWPNEAVFGAAEMLRALGRRDETLEKLGPLFHDRQFGVQARLRAVELYIDKNMPDHARQLLEDLRPTAPAERKERHLLRARSELISHHPQKAIGLFQSLLQKPEGATHAVIFAALFGLADAQAQQKTPEAGADTLEDFIEHHPEDVDLARIFAKLDELYRASRKPSRSELERWMRDPTQPRRGLARWYLARLEQRAGHRDRALQLFDDLRRDHARAAALARAFVEFSQLLIEDQHLDEAIGVLNEARALQPEKSVLDRVNLLVAQANYLARRFDAASAGFEQIAKSDATLTKLALFNASAGWLQLGEHSRFLADYEQLGKEGGDAAARADLQLEEGLVEAANGDPKAAESLQRFVRDFPQSPRVSEAWVALAELAFHVAPPRIDEARKDLAHAAESKPTTAAMERADYLRIWIEDAGEGNDVKVIELSNHFLRDHTDSPFASDVRMKLAETYFRRQDFSNAQTQFEILGQKQPPGPLTEKALFFSAQSAMSSMGTGALDRAIVLLDQVVRMNGELKWAARNEQAVIERKLGKAQDALSLYDEVLKSNARLSEKREALCAKGDIFFESGGNENYQRAIDAYEQLASEKDVPVHWQNQALFKKGLCLEKKKQRAAALETFYRVLENEKAMERRRELFWFYKAGFNAARLLEDDSKWDSAAAIYDKLAAAGGRRSEEAKERLNRLRLEHFLWAD